MRPLDDAGKNWWSIRDFSVMMVAVDPGPQQIRRTDWLSDQLTQRALDSSLSTIRPRSPDTSPVNHIWNMMGRRLHLPGNVDDLPRQLEQIWQEIPQETIRVLYDSMSRRVAACIQAKDRSTSY
ncbi:transposable element Tcb1 transposase [Trichonephila clavipes]|nr:transposable element Tcb1 transposase [Trichonephila clavipes]